MKAYRSVGVALLALTTAVGLSGCFAVESAYGWGPFSLAVDDNNILIAVGTAEGFGDSSR